ncbi:MAG: flagellar motor protein MotB [Candidatus Dactylopiibacterium sp.]|nr:flagellar motor protein MotB [Candidatus Dactylopiibacterium sp.]
MSGDNQQPIVVKRVRKGGEEGHGGAWKIAYADFVTAMMAFFLLMWLLGSTTQADLQGIADYFQNPLKVSMAGGPGSGSATSIINRGGEDLARSTGQVVRRSREEARTLPKTQVMPPPAADKAAREQMEREERLRLGEVKAHLEAMIEASPDLRQFKQQLLLDLTSEGLRIQIVDDQNRPMFDIGSDRMKPYTRTIVRAIGQVLNGLENKVSISGHTDAAQYAGGAAGFSNWELSANRANASRRELVAGGIEERKIMRVVGLASTIPLDVTDPFNPINRRITLIVMNKRTEEAVLNEGKDLDVSSEQPVDAEPIVDGARRLPGR